MEMLRGLSAAHIGQASANVFAVPDRGGIAILVSLSARRPDGRTAAPIQQLELDPCGIDGLPHEATERVDFTHQVSLCRAANGRIAGHMRHGVHRQRADADADAQPGRRKRSLTTGVTGANNHDVELPVGLHLPMQKRLNT